MKPKNINDSMKAFLKHMEETTEKAKQAHKFEQVREAWLSLCESDYTNTEVYIRAFGRGIAARTESLPPCGDGSHERIKILWNKRPADSDEEWLSPLIRDWILEINQDAVEKFGGCLTAYVMGVPYRFKPGKKPQKLYK